MEHTVATNEEIDKASFKPRQLRNVVLTALALAGIAGGIATLGPNFPILLASIMSLINKDRTEKIPLFKVRRVLKNLERKKIVSIREDGEDVYVELKEWNSTYILKHSIRQLLEFKRKEKRWNGKWFLVMFDVPTADNNKRQYLRKFLREIGFFKYQQSVYVFPYECEKEIQLLKKILESGKYMSYIIADRIEHDRQAKIHFSLH